MKSKVFFSRVFSILPMILIVLAFKSEASTGPVYSCKLPSKAGEVELVLNVATKDVALLVKSQGKIERINLEVQDTSFYPSEPTEDEGVILNSPADVFVNLQEDTLQLFEGDLLEAQWFGIRFDPKSNKEGSKNMRVFTYDRKNSSFPCRKI